jgi:putative membrane protein
MLLRVAVSWVVNAVVLAAAAWLLAGVDYDGIGSLVVAAAVFGILNTVLKPVAKLVTFPLAILTLGIAWFLVSMLMLWLTDAVVGGFSIDGFWTYVWATIIVWALNMLLDALLRDRIAAD